METETAPLVDPAENTTPTKPPLTPEEKAQQRRIIIVGVIVVVFIIAAVVISVLYLLQPGSPTETIRDIFIIFMAFEALVIGAALTLLVIQVARLINLLQNEVKPILESTSETVNTLRGTTEFLTDNMVEPVIKLNEYLAGLKRVLDLLKLTRDR